MQLVSDDVVTEALEGDHLALQNMSGSKYVQVLYLAFFIVLLDKHLLTEASDVNLHMSERPCKRRRGHLTCNL